MISNPHSYRLQRTLSMALALALLLFASVASAHRDPGFGGKFPHTAGNWLNIGFTQSGSYRTQVLAATSSWHSTPTKLIVFEESIATSEADFYTQNRAESWWGMTVSHPCPQWGCTYTWADLYLNSSTLGVESNFIRQKVAAHEFGHGIGLAHPPTSFTSLMRQGALSYNTPQSHDISDVNGIYP